LPRCIYPLGRQTAKRWEKKVLQSRKGLVKVRGELFGGGQGGKKVIPTVSCHDDKWERLVEIHNHNKGAGRGLAIEGAKKKLVV